MATKLRATIVRRPQPWARKPDPAPWRVTVSAQDAEGYVFQLWQVRESTQLEAMRSAHKLLKELDADLMAEVHASRAIRRTTKEEEA